MHDHDNWPPSIDQITDVPGLNSKETFQQNGRNYTLTPENDHWALYHAGLRLGHIRHSDERWIGYHSNVRDPRPKTFEDWRSATLYVAGWEHRR